MKTPFLLLVVAAIASVTTAVPIGFEEQELWKQIEISGEEIGTYKFELLPLAETNCLYITFGVKATSDAVVTLSPKNGITDDIYQIILGAEGNLFTCLVKGQGTKPVVDHPSVDILTGEWQYFWIKLEYGVLSVGHEGESEPFVQYFDENPFKVQYVGVTSFANVSSWKFFMPGFGNFPYTQEISDSGGQYFNFPNLPSCNCKWSFEFCVKAGGNALLTLSPKDKIVNDIYQIMIGAMDNYFTCIVKYNGTEPVVDVATLDILSPDEYRCFWVRFEDGTLEFGYFGQEDTPIASYTDLSPLEVSHIGVGSETASSWKLFFPCSYDPKLISVENPGEYYFQLPPLPEPEGCFYIRFGVYARRDAVITFSPENGITDDIYEVILGAENNFFTCIRRGRGTKPVVDTSTLDILENCWQYFWIRYSKGRLEVGREGSTTPFSVYVDPSPLPIKYVGVTSMEYPSRWKFFTHGFGREEFYYHLETKEPYNFVFPKLSSGSFYFEFGVRAQSDAVLTFSPKNAPVESIYQIIIGAEDNFFNCIVKGKDTKPVKDYVSEFLLSDCEFKYFWVRFENGLLEIGNYGCPDSFASFQDPNPYDIYYFSVGSLVGGSWWKIYLPCQSATYVCGGEEFSLTCDEGTINVKRAIYGRENSVYCYDQGTPACYDEGLDQSSYCGDVFQSTSIVQAECQGESSCVIAADGNTFDDSCAGFEYLEIEYDCAKDTTVHACEEEDLEIGCDDGYINIIEAVYGRLVDDICSDQSSNSTTDCQDNDAWQIVREACQGRESCVISAASYIFSDPCSGVTKYLQVTYGCDAEPYGGTMRPLPFVETEYQIETPGEYTFLDNEFTNKHLYLVFGVKAKTDAVITLSPSKGLEDNIYEVIIGAAGNLFVCLRRLRDTKPVVDISALDILEDRFQYFWITYCDGYLAVGRFGENTPLAAYIDPEPFDISYVGFTSLEFGSSWIFYLEYFGTFIFESNYRSRPFYPDVSIDAENGFDIQFIVRGNQDATIWLSPRVYAEAEDSLILYIGAQGNTASYIEYKGERLASAYGSFLQGDAERVFRLTYSSLTLQLQNGDGETILQAGDVESSDVNYLGFHSADGINYWWFYDLFFPFVVGEDGLTFYPVDFTRSYDCDGEVFLDCGNSYLYILDAIYGRENPRICPFEPMLQTDGCYTDRLLDALRDECHNKNNCSFNPSELENFCQETTKYLQWTYKCVNEIITPKIIDDEPTLPPIPLPDPVITEYTSGSDEYDYPLPELSEDSFFLHFCVRASSGASVALSSASENQSDSYIIIISAQENLVSISFGDDKVEVQDADILLPNSSSCLWIAYDDGQVALGKKGAYFPEIIYQNLNENGPSVSSVGLKGVDGDANWSFQTNGFGEYIRRSYESAYYPNLANLPQRRFKLCFGVRAESNAALLLSEEDGAPESQSLVINLGTSGNTKIELQYRNEWSIETVLDSVLNVETVTYFCIVLLDDCIRLEDENGTELLEGKSSVDYKYLRRIGFQNQETAYWRIRGVPYRFPALPSASVSTVAPTTIATAAPTTTTTTAATTTTTTAAPTTPETAAPTTPATADPTTSAPTPTSTSAPTTTTRTYSTTSTTAAPTTPETAAPTTPATAAPTTSAPTPTSTSAPTTTTTTASTTTTTAAPTTPATSAPTPTSTSAPTTTTTTASTTTTTAAPTTPATSAPTPTSTSAPTTTTTTASTTTTTAAPTTPATAAPTTSAPTPTSTSAPTTTTRTYSTTSTTAAPTTPETAAPTTPATSAPTTATTTASTTTTTAAPTTPATSAPTPTSTSAPTTATTAAPTTPATAAPTKDFELNTAGIHFLTLESRVDVQRRVINMSPKLGASARTRIRDGEGQTTCDLPPEDILVDITSPGGYKFELPEIEYEPFELHFRLKSSGCSILVLSDVNHLGSDYYEIGLGCDGEHYVSQKSEGSPYTATSSDAEVTDGEWHNILVIYKFGFIFVFANDGEEPIVYGVFASSLTPRFVGVTSTDDESWWLFPAEGFGSQTYEVDENHIYYLLLLHDDFLIPFDVRVCSEVTIQLLTQFENFSDADITIKLGSEGNTLSTMTYRDVTETHEGAVLNLNGVTRFELVRRSRDKHVLLIDGNGTTLLEIGYIPGGYNYLAFSAKTGRSDWYFYWCPLKLEDFSP